MTRYLKDMKVVDVYRRESAVEFVIEHPLGHCYVLRGQRPEPPALARYTFVDGDYLAYCLVDQAFQHPGLALIAAYECAREFEAIFGRVQMERLPVAQPFRTSYQGLQDVVLRQRRLAACG